MFATSNFRAQTIEKTLVLSTFCLCKTIDQNNEFKTFCRDRAGGGGRAYHDISSWKLLILRSDDLRSPAMMNVVFDAGVVGHIPGT